MRIVTLALVFALLLTTQLPAAEKTNVVFILADDLGWADLGCYGSKYHKTPHLDRFATSAMRFTQGYAACPVCSPTRASIMTGRYPARLNLTDWLPGRADRPDQKLLRPVITQHLPKEEITLPQALKAAGYVTGHIGKWHLGGKGSLPEERGFDSNVGGEKALDPVPAREDLTDRLTAEAEKFIEANRDKPFFLYLAHHAPHIPLKARPELVAKYQKGKPGEQGNPIYAAVLESLDEGVGRVLKKLDDLKLTEKTLVIFTSDNGGLCVIEGPDTPATINSPLREGKGYLYEGGIRVPLIMRWPGVTKAGAVSSEVVSSLDFMPTILEACTVKSEVKFDGISMVPSLRGEPRLLRPELFWHYPHYSNQGGKPGSAVRAGDYKLIEFLENGRRELFDVRKDPGETHNLIESEPAIAERLAERLHAWRREVGARMMKPNQNFVPNPQAKDGTILLPARTAEVHGVMLRFEPLPHKNTLGYWVRADDWASWEFTVTKPGKFDVEVLQGCGQGQGGSEVEISLGEQKLEFTVEDTGHFQNFKARTIGSLTLEKPGRFTLTVKPVKKAAVAVMDLRSITLKKTEK
jgi:arylsulfatase A